MIDVENAVFNHIASSIRSTYLSTYPKMKIYGEYVEFPEDFPCISLWCTDNYTYRRSQDESSKEHHANVLFSTEVYTTGQNRKAIAKKLANAVDELFQDIGFTRSAMMVLPNVDRNAFRITMRHTGVVEAPITTTSNGVDTQTFLIFRE